MRTGTALALARELMTPVLEEHGYSAGRRSGPGLEWTKPVETGRFAFLISTGRWDELSGGKLQVEFGGDGLDLFYSMFLHYLGEPEKRRWQDVVSSIYDRALGGVADAIDEDLVETRRMLLAQELAGLEAGYLDAFGWPWFDEQDLGRLYGFVAEHFDSAEEKALADARSRRAEAD